MHVTAVHAHDKVLICKISFGKKNIRTQSKIINFNPRAPQHRTCGEEEFGELCKNVLDNFFLPIFFP